MKKNKLTLCIDFDGVLHWYRKGWQGIENIYDEPVPGALEFVSEAQDHFNVVIYSSRAKDSRGLQAIKKWLIRHEFPHLEITVEKPPAFLSIDDRAIQFKGQFWKPKELLDFKPWNI